MYWKFQPWIFLQEKCTWQLLRGTPCVHTSAPSCPPCFQAPGRDPSCLLGRESLVAKSQERGTSLGREVNCFPKTRRPQKGKGLGDAWLSSRDGEGWMFTVSKCDPLRMAFLSTWASPPPSESVWPESPCALPERACFVLWSYTCASRCREWDYWWSSDGWVPTPVLTENL